MFPNSLLGQCDFFRPIVANFLPLEILIITPFSPRGSSCGSVHLFRSDYGQLWFHSSCLALDKAASILL